MFYPYWAIESYFNPSDDDNGSMKTFIKFEKPFIALYLGSEVFQFKNNDNRQKYKILKFFYDNEIIGTFESFAKYENLNLEDNNE